MKKRVCLVIATTAVLATSIGASSASAATEFGSECLANRYFNGGDATITHNASDPLPVAAPVAGVLTEWKVNVGTIPGVEGFVPTVLNQGLYVIRSVGPDEYVAIGRSDSGTVQQNAVNSFGARIPVQVGDLLALDGPTALVCDLPESPEKAIEFRGQPYIGASFQATKPLEDLQVPVSAKIEPDVDGDGYGDETQDDCLQSSRFHEACPTVAIKMQPNIGAKAVNVSVTTDLSAPVSVNATVALGKGREATLTAPTQTVAPGDLATFNLGLPPGVVETLKRLAKSKSLMVTITASAPNIGGAPSQTVSVAKLRGHSAEAATRSRTKKKPTRRDGK